MAHSQANLSQSTAHACGHADREQTNSVIVWEGPSPIDGGPIVAVLTGLVRPSANRKTGPMLQLSILRADMDALAASKAGADRSICGDCPLRWASGGGCYVNLGQAPLAVSRAYLRGNLPRIPLADIPQLVSGKAVRLGSYGDPGMLPLEVLRALTGTARMWTGYTHQWRTLSPEYAGLLMASTDTVADRMAAPALGWRFFGLSLDPKPGSSERRAGRGLARAGAGGNLRRGTRGIGAPQAVGWWQKRRGLPASGEAPALCKSRRAEKDVFWLT